MCADLGIGMTCAKETKKKGNFPPPLEADGLKPVQKNIFFLKKNQF